MSNEEDIHCFLFEQGGSITFKNKEKRALGSKIVQSEFIGAVCSYKAVCPFYIKHGECPTWEEIQLKYRQEGI